MSKSVLKSVRMDPALYEYINSYRGDGFNQKFANIILDAMYSEEERRARLAALDRELERKKAAIQEIHEVVSSLARKYLYF